MSNLERTTSLPARMDEMRVGEEDFSPRGTRQLRRSSSMPVAEGRVRSAREFPPLLGSLARKSTSPAQMMPLSRLRCVRSNGRIVLTEVKIANQMTLHTVRHQGRLVLNLVPCKENAAPRAEDSKAPQVAETAASDDHRIEASEDSSEDEKVPVVCKEEVKVEEVKEVSKKVDDQESKLRADHAHVLQELMAAYAARVVRQMSCNRPVVWDHNHHFHCVTTSS